MDKIEAVFTVFFEEPFWVGVFERIEGGELSVCKVTFGAEPTDAEVYEFVLTHYRSFKFSPAVAAAVKRECKNPKRMKREIQKKLNSHGIGTKSQQALKLQQEQFKTERKVKCREQKELEKQRRFELKQQKRLKKRRGH